MLYCFELPSDSKVPHRVIGVLADGILFRIEQNVNPRWDEDKYTVWHISGSPYTQGLRWGDRNRLGDTSSILAARKLILDRLEGIKKEVEKESGPSTSGKTSVQVEMLPAGDCSDFYPTPMQLAGKMLSYVDWKTVNTILEPSAGKGDLIFAVQRMAQSRKYSDKFSMTHELAEKTFSCFDVIESDYNLRLMLRGLGLRLVDDDFLNFRTEKRYDLTLMNPPFSEGVRHLIHAIQLMDNGGQIVCLLNAETIRNPYTNERKLLKKLLAERNAHIEFVKKAFKRAERKSDVEVAIIYINIPSKRRESDIFSRAQKAAKIDIEAQRVGRDDQLVVSDEIEQLIEFYNAEAKAGVEFLRMYDELSPCIMEGDDKYSKPLIGITIHDHKYSSIGNQTVNEYLHDLRYKYWKMFLNRPSLRSKMTSAMCSEYSEKISEMANYEFNRHNIAQALYDIQSQLVQGVEEAIVALFDKLSAEHSWCKECGSNIHYYNGWATNKAHKVNDKKVILPINGFSSYSWEPNKLDEYSLAGTISDLEKALSYLDKGEIGWSRDPYHVIKLANEMGNQKQELTFTYFTTRFYKKGTCHITWHEQARPIIERLNIFAARQRAWLPPCYGRKAYQDMTKDEKAVVDEFQGAEAYGHVMENPSRFIVERVALLPMLSA